MYNAHFPKFPTCDSFRTDGSHYVRSMFSCVNSSHDMCACAQLRRNIGCGEMQIFPTGLSF